MTRPFRFAVQATKAESGAEWRDLARRTEALGYSTLFLADHYFGPGPAQAAAHAPIQYVAPIAAMATAAAATTTLRVGCRVFCIDYHVPVALVKEAATIDLLSDGRLEFGIGAGWSPGEYEAMGLEFGTPGERVSKLREVVALFKASCAGAELPAGYRALPQTPQRPHPPIMVGGGRQRVLTFAAQQADIVSMNNVHYGLNEDGFTPQEEAERRYGWVRDGAGDRLPGLDLEASPFFTVVTDDPSAEAERIAPKVRTEAATLADHPNVLLGSVSDMVERLLERRERYGVNYVTVQQSALETFAPVVEKLAGA